MTDDPMGSSHAIDPEPPALAAELPAVYAELRRQAARALRREGAGHTLGATALVHEAYLRFADQGGGVGRNRVQFVGVAARLMRQILVDHARTRQAAKRGGGAVCVTLDRAGGVVLLAYDDGGAYSLFGVDASAAAAALLRLSNDVAISVR